jgi:hypothetical protein
MGTQPVTPVPARSKLINALGNYGASLAFVVVVPLLPIFIEWSVKRSLGEEPLLITASIYGATIAIASNKVGTFAIGLVAALAEASLYGVLFGIESFSNTKLATVAETSFLGVSIKGGQPTLLWFGELALISIIVLTLFTAIERFSRHVLVREEFLEFLKGKV